MNPNDDDRHANSRRCFLLSSGRLFTGAWIAAQWPAISAAAHHADDAAGAAVPLKFKFLTAADAADVEAIAAQIVPSGATPGAREAHAVYFIDRAMTTFLAPWAAEFGPGLRDFQRRFGAAQAALASFAQASPKQQFAYLKSVERTAFFDRVRMLTVLGMFSSPKYGGNFGGAGWQLMGFEDRHAFTPPFGYYDRNYSGFVPYSTGKSA
jgi:hypothetical protein